MRPSFLLAAICLVGCVDQGAGPQPKKVDPGYVGKHLLAAAPELTPRLDIDLGGKVVYLGNKVSVERAVPGAAFTITHYWKVIASPGPGWQVFSMLRGEPTKPDFMNLPATDMQRAHGPATWKAGEIIEDEQEIFLRPDWRSIDVTVHVGLIQTGAHGIGDRLAATGPNTKDRAVIARRLEVDLSKAPPPPGTLHVLYAKGAITIDGTANDQGWMGISSSPEWPTAEGSPEPVGKAIGRITWDTDHLYVYANVTDSEVFSEFKNQDDPLWKQDCVELFIDADGNRRGYVELQVNPNNATFDSWFPAGRAAKGDEEWDSNMQTAAQINPGVGWEVEIAIPWAAIKGRDESMQVRLPPQVGDRWRLNVVRVDKKVDAKSPSASSWNRITYQDWHGLDRMLTVVFADQTGGVAPGTSPIPLPPPGTDPGAGSGSAIGSGGMMGSGTTMGSGSAAGSSGSLTIEIAANGAMLANGKAIAEADLGNLFRAAFARDKLTNVILVTDPAVPHATVVRFTDLAKAAGITKFSIAATATSLPATLPGRGSAVEQTLERSRVAPPSPSIAPRGGAGSGSAAPPSPPEMRLVRPNEPAPAAAASAASGSGSAAGSAAR